MVPVAVLIKGSHQASIFLDVDHDIGQSFCLRFEMFFDGAGYSSSLCECLPLYSIELSSLSAKILFSSEIEECIIGQRIAFANLCRQAPPAGHEANSDRREDHIH